MAQERKEPKAIVIFTDIITRTEDVTYRVVRQKKKTVKQLQAVTIHLRVET